MNLKITLIIMIAISFLFPNLTKNQTFSQTTDSVFKPEVKIGGQIRYRGELDLRFFDFNAKPIFINMLRTRLNADIKISPNVKAFIQFQDSRNFGEEQSRSWRGTLDGTADNFDLHQGYIELNDLLLDNLTLRFGRMMFNVNSERIIGSLDWHNVGRAYDGGYATYKFDEGWQARAFAFLLGTEELLMTSATQQIPKMVGGLDINLPYIPGANIFAFYDKNDRTLPGLAPGAATSLPKLSRYTFGLFTKSDKPGFVWEFEAAMQAGTIDTLPRLMNDETSDISAWMVSVYGGFKEGAFTIGGGVDAMSGDNPETDIYEGFDHLFFTLHKFYGAMDFFPFTVLPSFGIRPGIAGTNLGLIMPNIRASWLPSNRWKLDAQVMLFRTTEAFNFQGEELFNLGTEIDLLASCEITKGVSAQFGSSIFLPGKILSETNPSRGMGTDPSYWGYTMITVNF